MAAVDVVDAFPMVQADAVERDVRGQVVADGHHRYAYTLGGEIENVTTMDGRFVARYRYNALGQRTSKTLASGATTFFLWQDGRVVAEIESVADGAPVVVAQYLYLGDQGHVVPVAKWESAHARGNASGRARMLFIHVDHRGQPVAMTDRKQDLVWRGSPDTWGHVDAGSTAHQGAVLDLRLPGQTVDEETGLHDNWHRSYDARPDSPLRGHYLAPDPLGYPDGPDPTAYVGGDPVNRIDPTGLYEEDVHFDMTYFLAIVSGLTPRQALIIASADRYIDDNPDTEPYGSLGGNLSARYYYHFTQDGHDTSTDPATRYLDPVNPQLTLLHENATSSVAISPQATLSACARLQFYGEFLHAYQDTYAHRDQDNVPYGATAGHLSGGHNPDYTYDHVDSLGRDWQYNEARTQAMEQGVFGLFQADFGSSATDARGHPIAWGQLVPTMQAFNSNRASEPTIQPKIDILDAALEALGFADIPRYSCNAARTLRLENLRDASGRPLRQDDYVGTILATPAQSEPCR